MHEALARSTDPATAHEAAEQVTAHLSGLERRVCDAMAALGHPVTSRAIAVAAGLDLVTVSPRLRPLCDRGIVREAGVHRPESGRAAVLWALVAA